MRIFLILFLIFVGVFNVNAEEATTTELAVTHIQRVSDDGDITQESIEKVSVGLVRINNEAKVVESEVRLILEDGINDSISSIRDVNDIEVYLLQRSIEEARRNILDSLQNGLRDTLLIDAEGVEKIYGEIESNTLDMEEALFALSDVEVSLEEVRLIVADRFNDLKEEIAKEGEDIVENGGELIFLDTDEDGLSDYDEVYIYHTDPSIFNTTGGDSDSVKVLNGINPISETFDPIDYSDPKEDDDKYVSDIYGVDKVDVVNDLVVFRGTGLPNSYITLYIFSTPIIKTIKTDVQGKWQYSSDKLDDGDHQIFITTVDGTGDIVASSEPISFIKNGSSVSIGSFIIDEPIIRNEKNTVNIILILTVIFLIPLVVLKLKK